MTLNLVTTWYITNKCDTVYNSGGQLFVGLAHLQLRIKGLGPIDGNHKADVTIAKNLTFIFRTYLNFEGCFAEESATFSYGRINHIIITKNMKIL